MFFYWSMTEFNVFSNTLFQNKSNITRNASKGQTRPYFLHADISFVLISLHLFSYLDFYACFDLKLISLLTLLLYHHHTTHPTHRKKDYLKRSKWSKYSKRNFCHFNPRTGKSVYHLLVAQQPVNYALVSLVMLLVAKIIVPCIYVIPFFCGACRMVWVLHH